VADTLVRAQRCGIEDRHELCEVLAHDCVLRRGEVRLRVLSVRQGRAVRLREDGEAEADDDERDGDRGMAGIARERECGEPRRDGRVSQTSLGEPESGCQEPRRSDRCDERDQPGDEQQERAGPAAAQQRRRVRGAARETDHDRNEGAEGERVDGCERKPADGDRAHADGDDEDDRGGRRECERREPTTRVERTVREH
jgi:hypothetical protein